jgi:SAM-dependent methyltransferase
MLFRMIARTYLSRFAGLLLGVACLALQVGRCQAARLEVSAPSWSVPLLREAAARYVEETGNQVDVVPYRPANLMEYAQRTHSDVLILGCYGDEVSLAKEALIQPGSARPITYSHVSAIVAPTNPKHVRGLEDLTRPDLRWAMCGLDAERFQDLFKEAKPTFAYTTGDPATALDLLVKGRVDAVLGWDGDYVTTAYNPVVIRLPVSRYGIGVIAKSQAAVSAHAPSPAAAADLVTFLSSDVGVKDSYLRRGFMIDDGAWAASYDKEKAPRFQPVYQSVSRQLVEDYGVTRGVALDLGSGPGLMTLALAKTTQLRITGVDQEPEMVELARKHAAEAELTDRVQFVCADAHSLPFPDDSVDLIVSRGMLPFLRDQALAMRECYRVLKPGGVALVGCGEGRYVAKSEEVETPEMAGDNWYGADPSSRKGRERSIFPFPVKSFDALMTRAGIPVYKAILDHGTWVEFRKPLAGTQGGRP